MASNNGGMFGTALGDLFAVGGRASRQEDLDEEKRLSDLAHMDGFTADRLATYQGADMAGKGLGSAIVSAAGQDPRTPVQRNEAAIQAAKAKVQQLGFNPTDPASIDAFYRQVMQILQGEGLIAEAMAVAKEWNAQKQTDEKHQLAVGESARKAAADAAKDKAATDRTRIGDERNAILKANGVPEYGKLMDLAEKAEDPEQRKMYVDRLNFLAGKAGKGIAFEDAGDRVIVRDKATGNVLSTDNKGLTPKDEAKGAKADDLDKAAYANIKADMQRQMDRAAQLYNHPGLSGITGRVGRQVGRDGFLGELATTASGDNSRAALDLHTSVVGGTLMSGLTKLKMESNKGASGLGALSEKEGSKVQADTAALDRNQGAKDFKLRISEYIDNIMAAGARLDAKAAEKEVPVIPLQKPALTGPKRGATAAPAAPVAPVAPPTAATVPVKNTEWELVNGKLVQKK